MSDAADMNIFDYTNNKLKAHLQNNETFTIELAQTYEYYEKQLMDLILEHDKERLERELFHAVKSQVFNGYFMAQEILANIELKDEWFEQTNGMIAQQIPEMLRNGTNDNIEEIITHDPLKNLSSWLVIEYEDVYPLLMNLSLNTASLGAKWAFLDEAQKRNVTPYKPQHSGILAYVDDVVFINPQTYLSCEITNETSELWTVISSKYNGLDKIAEVTILKLPNNEQLENFYLNISISKNLILSEQEFLIDQLVDRLMRFKGIERNQLTLSAMSVEEFYYITNNPN